MQKNNEILSDDIETVVVGIGDLNGMMRGKRLPVSQYLDIRESGLAMSMVILTMDMTSDIWDTPQVSMDNGYPDMQVIPTGELRRIPWEENAVFTLATSMGMDHKPLSIDPRNALVKVTEKAREKGYEIRVGTELEFYLLDPETMQPIDNGIQVYGLARAAELEHVLGPMRTQLNQMGIPIEQSNPEYAAGQVEVNIRYDEALLAADRVVCFRSFIKELAAKHGYYATFMAKPFFEESGNGFHVHHSVWQGDRNLMADSGHLSDFGRHYLGGLQKYMPEISLSCSGTPNAYKRRVDGSFCPMNNTWGVDNRTLGLRVIEGSDSAVRIEKRDGAADVNPYLMLAMDIAAGLKGVEEQLEPTPETTGNGYKVTDHTLLPTDLDTAIELAKQSELMYEVIGEDLMAIVLSQAERELAFYKNQITQVERDRYLRNF